MALEWLTLHALGSAEDPSLSTVWATCEEAEGCVQAGLMRRKGKACDAEAAEGLLAWFLKAGHDKTVPEARLGAFNLLAGAVQQTPPGVVAASLEKLVQLLRSGMSPASSPACRIFACRAAEALVRKAWAEKKQRSDLRQRVQQDVLPRLVTSWLACAAVGSSTEDAAVQTAGLLALATTAEVTGMTFKPHAAKMEAAAYAALDSPVAVNPALREAAIACLVRVPFTYSDAGHWTTMLLALLEEAARALKQVWPDAPVPSSLLLEKSTVPSSANAGGGNTPSHKPGWTALPLRAEKGEGAVKAYALRARTRIQAALEAVVALVHVGHHHGSTPVLLPSPALLGMCEALLSATPRGKSNLGATPAALPATALQALQPLLRSLGLDLLSSFVAAASTSALRHLPRVARLVLRALSWPAAQGFLPRAYALVSSVILVTGPSTGPKLVEPALPLLTMHASLYLQSIGSPLLANQTVANAPVIGGKKGNPVLNQPGGGGGSGGSDLASEMAEMGEQDVAEVERAGVVLFEALATALLGCGALLGLDGRLSIERMVGVGLNDLNRGIPRPTASSSASVSGGLSWVRRNAALRAAFLDLATRALLVPRRDGAGSALVPLAARVFNALVLDTNPSVAQAAMLGRAAAETITHTRAVPLYIPSALLQLDDDKAGFPASSHPQENSVFPFLGAAGSGGGGGQSNPGGGGGGGVSAAVMELDHAPAAAASMGEAQVAAVWSQATDTAAVPSTSAAPKAGGGDGGLKRDAPEAPITAAKKGKQAKPAAAPKAVPPPPEEEEDDDEPLPSIVDDGGPDDKEE